MTVAHLQQHLQQCSLILSGQLGFLENAVIGIDVLHFTAAKGDPASLVDLLKSVNAKALFVFPGTFDPGYASLQKNLRDLNVEYIVAPYTSLHQLNYLLQNKVINAVYSSTSFLLFDIGKVILSLDKTFKYIDKSHMLTMLNLKQDRFVELAMIASNTIQPKKLSAIFSWVQPPMTTLDDVEKQRAYIEGQARLLYTPVLKLDGRVDPIQIHRQTPFLAGKVIEHKQDSVPGDLYALFAAKLPDELYFHASLGFTLPVLDLIRYNKVKLEIFSDEYWAHPKTKDIWSKIVDIIGSCCHRGIRKATRKIIHPKGEIDINISIFPNYWDELDQLRILHPIDMEFDWDTFAQCLPDQLTKWKGGIKTDYEIIGTALLRSMYVYNLITDDGITDNGQYVLKNGMKGFVEIVGKDRGEKDVINEIRGVLEVCFCTAEVLGGMDTKRVDRTRQDWMKLWELLDL
ncbi:Mkt1 protein [Martiniozyma asiatica (nom. inval.)]|nr:Mkt1 protein [Martiniozyma asiatica]